MANLIEYIQSQIYENSTEDISGSIMQQVLTRMASDEGVVNVHTISGQTPFADYNNAQAARDAVPAGFKKVGLIITYKLSSGWYIDEFIGSATSGWSTSSNWKCLGPISVSQNAETGKTTITIGSQSYDVATQPVSVSQNTSTGHTEINIGGVVYPVASVDDVEGNTVKQPYFIDGYIDGLGRYFDNSDYKLSSFIPIDLVENLKDSEDTLVNIIYYDDAKEFQLYDNPHFVDGKVEVRKNYKYFRYWHENAKIGNISIEWIKEFFNGQITAIINSKTATPTQGSSGLMTSGGVAKLMEHYLYTARYDMFVGNDDEIGTTDYIPAKNGDVYELNYGGVTPKGTRCGIIFYDENKDTINGVFFPTSSNLYSGTVPYAAAAFIRFTFNLSSINSVYYKLRGDVVYTPILSLNDYPNYFKKSSIDYSPITYGVTLDCLVDFKLYCPDTLQRDIYITKLGYSETDKKVYVGFRTTDGNTLHYGYTSVFEKPTDNSIRTYGIIFNDSSLIYATITIDWYKYTNAFFLDDASGVGTYKDIIVRQKRLSELDKIIGEEILIDSTITLQNINLVGDNTTIKVTHNGKFVSMCNCSVSGFTFDYIGTGAITEREVWEDGHGNFRLVPLKSEQDFESGNLFSDSYIFMRIQGESKQCSITNCVFNYFSNFVIYNEANGRHIDGDHIVIEGNLFYYCFAATQIGEEFARFAHNEFVGCCIGTVCVISDMQMVDNKYLRCDVGLYFPANNDAYGFANSCTMNHCGVAAIYAHLITSSYGFIINNAEIVQAPIICLTAYALSICNSMLNTYFRIDAGAKNRIVQNMMHNEAATTELQSLYDVPSDTLVADNRAIRSDVADSVFNTLS